MRHPNLDPRLVALLLTCIVILVGSVLIRGVLIFRRQRAGVPHRYPGGWTNDQIKVFERLRLWIGIALAVTWAALWTAAPQMPQGWPFGLQEILFTIGLLVFTDAWLSLLVPANWERSLLSKLGFVSTFAILALAWMAMLTGFLVTIHFVAAKQLHLLIPIGVFV